jgi:hypothetical protein
MPFAHLLLHIAEQPGQADALPFAWAFLLLKLDVEIMQYPCIHLQREEPTSEKVREVREVREDADIQDRLSTRPPGAGSGRKRTRGTDTGVPRTETRTDKDTHRTATQDSNSLCMCPTAADGKACGADAGCQRGQGW